MRQSIVAIGEHSCQRTSIAGSEADRRDRAPGSGRYQPHISGDPAVLVLADEDPHIYHTLIASDHPITPHSPQDPQYPASSSALYNDHTSTIINPPNPPQTGSQSANLPSPSSSTSAPPVNHRRRRRTSSPINSLSESLGGRQDSNDLAAEAESRSGAGTRESQPFEGRPPNPKRRRLMHTEMRYDPDNSSSNGTHHSSNGSQISPLHKAPFSNGTNGTNGTNGHSTVNGSSPSQSNGFSPHISRTQAPTFFGHDREEVTRLLIQGLGDLGYHGAAERLSQESGYEVESPAVAAFRHAVLQGEWSEAEHLLFGSEPLDGGGGVSHYGLKFKEDADLDHLRFRLREQKYLELLEMKDLGSALMVLRQELTPLNQDKEKLHSLSSLIVSSPEELKRNLKWDGAMGRSRSNLLHELSRSISASVMIPEHRLAVLLDQIKHAQIAKCLYHNPSTSPSLFSDHMCDRSQFPLRTILELDQNMDEVYSLEFSHDGRKLATCGKDKDVLVYDTSSFQVLYRLMGHNDSVPYLTWSPDDSKLISCSRDYRAKVWDMASGQSILTINHHDEAVTTASWAPDGQTFLTGSLHGPNRLCLWSVEGQMVHSWQVDYRVQDCAVSPNGQRLVVISSESQIFVYNFVTREEEYSILLKDKMTCISISKDSRYMLINMAPKIKPMDKESDKEIGVPCEIQLIDIETAEITRRFLGQYQGHYIIRSSFGGADENIVLSGSE
ncbi:MAG: hypothetical protein Q9214_000567, partial [Letrouitia sp. 1 TL-2023]